MNMIRFSVLLSFFLANTAFAVTGFVKGSVQYVRVHDGDIYTTWKPPKFWFTLNGVTSAGSCPTWHGNILFSMESDTAYSMVLAAQMASKEIAVHYDDSKLHTDGNYCKGVYVTSGNPPPLH